MVSVMSCASFVGISGISDRAGVLCDVGLGKP